jgi:hypothetical protein
MGYSLTRLPEGMPVSSSPDFRKEIIALQAQDLLSVAIL